MSVMSRKWEHNLGHDGLTAEHNSLVEAANALAAALRQVEKSSSLSARQRDEVRGVLANYYGPVVDDPLLNEHGNLSMG